MEGFLYKTTIKQQHHYQKIQQQLLKQKQKQNQQEKQKHIQKQQQISAINDLIWTKF